MLYQVINGFAVTAKQDQNYAKQDQNYLHCCNLVQRKNNLLVQAAKVLDATKQPFMTLSRRSLRDFKTKAIFQEHIP